jgi:hypothetical protein
MNKTCEFCKKEFSTLSNLRSHLKSSKKCISSRLTEDKEQSVILDSFNCEYCNKEFTTKRSLVRHLDVCKKKELKEVVQQLKPEINNDINSELIRLREENKMYINELIRLKEENASMKVQLEGFHKAEEKKEEAKVKRAQKREIKQRDGYTDGKTYNITNSNSNNSTTNNITINLEWYPQFAEMTPINDPLLIESYNKQLKTALKIGACAGRVVGESIIKNNAILKTSDNKEKNHYYITNSVSPEQTIINYCDINSVIENIYVEEECLNIAKQKYDEYKDEETSNHLRGLSIIPNPIFRDNYNLIRQFRKEEKRIVNNEKILESFVKYIIKNAKKNKYNSNSITNNCMSFNPQLYIKND